MILINALMSGAHGPTVVNPPQYLAMMKTLVLKIGVTHPVAAIIPQSPVMI